MKRFSTRIMCAVFLINLVLVLVLSLMFYHQDTKRVFSYVEADFIKTMDNAAAQIDRSLTTIENIYTDLLMDREIFEFFQNYEEAKLNTVKANEKVQRIISTYTMHAPEVYSIQFLGAQGVFYDRNTSHASIYNALDSEVYRQAQEAKPSVRWLSTYDYTQAYHHTALQDQSVPIRNRYMLSLVGVYEPCFFQKGGLIRWLDASVERPVLVINLLESYLKDILTRSGRSGQGWYFIVDSKGQVISHPEDAYLFTWLPEESAAKLEACEQPAGSYSHDFGQGASTVYYVTLTNGWRLMAVSPSDAIRKGIMWDIAGSMLVEAALVLVLCLALGALVSQALSRPIQRLSEAIAQTGSGDFSVSLPEPQNDFGALVRAFNRMNRQIRQLIEDNYKSRLREKETQLMALKYQTNPHFLYNALTILCMQAQRGGDRATASLTYALSDMMGYVVRDRRDMVCLRDELNNVSSYMRLIEAGYEGAICCRVEVEEALFEVAVPKLCLQPLVENAVMHGLHGRRAGGEVIITAARVEDAVTISVLDNGSGLASGLDLEQGGQDDSTSIGLKNVHQRIRLLCGEGFGVRVGNRPEGGAWVRIRVPWRQKG